MTIKRRNFLQLAGGLALVGCGGSGSNSAGFSGQGTVLDPAAVAARLEADVAANQAIGLVPGISASIVTPTSTWTHTLGKATVGPDRNLAEVDNFSWRSVTKSVVVTVILQLVQEGLLRLDDAAIGYVPNMPGGESVRVRNLADMSSGLSDYVKVQAVIDLLIQDPLGTPLPSQLIDPALAEGLHFVPGSEYEYCNTNTLILGQILESVLRRPLGEILSDRIFRPLGMNNTFYLSGPDRPEPATQGYVFENGNFEEVRLAHAYLGAAGALAGPLQDARIWARALSFGSLISPALQEERRRGRPAVNGPIYDSYGLGMGEVQGWLGHTGEGVGYALGFFGEPLSGSTITILMNGSNAATHNQPLRLLRQFLATLGWPIPVAAGARP